MRRHRDPRPRTIRPSNPSAGPPRRLLAGALGATLAASLLTAAPAAAAPNADVPYPVFHGSDTPVPPVPGFTTDSMMRAIHGADLAAGAGQDTEHDFWMDRMLTRTGTAGEAGESNQFLFSRGRAVFMKEHQPAVLGFGGTVAYWEAVDARPAFVVEVAVDGTVVPLTEVTSARKQTPSYWRSEHRNAGLGLSVVQTKFITDANVLVTNLEVRSDAARTVELRASSPYAAAAEGGELTGGYRALNDLTTVYPRLSGDGFAPDGDRLVATLTVPAGGSATTKVQLGMITDEIADSLTEYEAYRAAGPAEAYTTHVTAYNAWWAENLPYLDTPEDNIDKTLYYRWWLLRFNYLDADMPGNTFQFPTAMEGVLGYNNAIDLTVGMFVDDLKYLRDPIYSYGGWISAGEVASGGQFRDNPGDPANWNASHTQYISEAAWRSYQIHGGPAPVVEAIARYAERDVMGQLLAMDPDGNGLLATNWNAWTGNDADAISFAYYGRHNERAESAYVYAGALVSAEAYRMLGQESRAAQMDIMAHRVKNGVLTYLWDPTDRLIKHRDLVTGQLIPWKEINNYYPFTVGLMPREGEADYDDDYVDALRLFADSEEYPIFPFATANQADQAAAAAAGAHTTNNFSIINSTVTFRMLSRVLREYPTEWIDAEWYKKLLYWNAYAHYMNDGDNRLPDANEFWANGSTDPQRIAYRSWIHHTILGTTNFTVIEDAMGLRPRSDDKIELYPIDVDWPYFAANHLPYRGADLTLVWDEPGDGLRPYGDAVPEGYSLFLDGELAFTVDQLTHVVYDPVAGTVTFAEDVVNDVVAPEVLAEHPAQVVAPMDVAFDPDARIVDVLAKASREVVHAAPNLARGRPVTASTAGTTKPAGLAVDGLTVSELYWLPLNSSGQTDWLEVDLGSPQPIDRVRVFFYATSSSRTDPSIAPPDRYSIEYHDGTDWRPVPDQTRTPTAPRANLNESSFPAVTTQRVRLVLTHASAPGVRTAVKELQVFHTGEPAGPVTNAAPTVTTPFQDRRLDQTGQVRVVARVGDDALPVGSTLTRAWSVVEAPEGATAILVTPARDETDLRVDTTGRYLLRLTATDGEATTSRDVVVHATAADDAGVNVAPSATPTASYTAAWNDIDAVNNGIVVHSGGDQTELWGTWSWDRPPSQWLQYTWPRAVRIDGSEMAFWTDSAGGTGDNVAVPQSWTIQYRDGAGAWADLPDASGYGTARTAVNRTDFTAVTTTAVRATFQAMPNAAGTAWSGVGVSEWRILAVPVAGIDDVHVRTAVGVLPELPETVAVVHDDGARLTSSVAWEPVDQTQVAAEGDFALAGIVAGTARLARATVWVRDASAVTITGVAPISLTVPVGTAPVLPPTVTVLYNDGSRVSGVPVTWDPIDPERYATDATFVVLGAVPGTDFRAEATVVVGDGASDTVAPEVTVTVVPLESGWAAGPVTVTVDAVDDVTADPRIEVRLDGVWRAYDEPVVVTEDGEHDVAARATDDAGNVSEEVTASFGIDTVAPVPTVTFDAGRATVTVVEDGSGLASLEYRLDDAAWTPYVDPVAVGADTVAVWVRATDVAGNSSGEVAFEVARGPQFVDVPPGHPFYADIRWLADTGLSTGSVTGDGTFFFPSAPVSRQAFAAFIHRYVGADFEPAGQTFSDVPPDHPFFVEIEWMAAEGLSEGYGDGTYRPASRISRQAVAAFLHRLAGAPAADPADFTDVPVDHPHATAIAWLSATGLTTGYDDGTFRPGAEVSRQATAAFLHRFDAVVGLP